MVDKKGVDMAEMLDELVQDDRYGKRNYRNSLGVDNRRHWRGTFVITESSEDVEVDEDQLANFMNKQYDNPEEAEGDDGSPSDASDTQGMFIPDIPVVDNGAAYNIAEPVNLAKESSIEEKDRANFFDPLANIDQLDEVMDTPADQTDEPTSTLYSTEDESSTEPSDETDDVQYGTKPNLKGDMNAQ